MKRWLVAALITLMALFGMPSAAMAHAVETNYLLEDLNLLEFQSTFSTGEPLQYADVHIFAPNNLDQPWKEMTTDGEGRFAFTPDLALQGDWNVYIEKDYHEDIWTIPVGPSGVDFDNISDRPHPADWVASLPHLPHRAGLLAAAGAVGIVITTRRWQKLS